MPVRQKQFSIDEFHWQFGLLEHLDVGLVVLDSHGRVELWNRFMSSHSGILDRAARGHTLDQLFSDFPSQWFKRKMDSVLKLRSRAFIVWEERPYLFRFAPHHPITGASSFMYQNVTLIPLVSPSGQIEHVGLMIHDMTLVAISQRKLQQTNSELERLSRTDKLSGLANRSHWETQLSIEFERFQRSQSPSSLVMLDVDHFKKINDGYGHQAGDEVIKLLGGLLKKHCRSTDTAGRYGGEEFGILLIDTASDQAEVFAERVRRAVERLNFSHFGTPIDFTISLGVAEVSNDQANYEAWIAGADRALYASKHSGRNRTTLLAALA